MLRADGSCPSCGPVPQGDGPHGDGPREPIEIGHASLTLFVLLGGAPRSLRQPSCCACCGTTESVSSIEVPSGPRTFLPVSGCAACVTHLAPPRAAWAAPLGDGGPAVALSAARWVGSDPALIVGAVLAAAFITA